MAGRPKALMLGVGAERGIGAGEQALREGGPPCPGVAGRTTEKIEQVIGAIRKAGGCGHSRHRRGTREEESSVLFDKAWPTMPTVRPAELLIFNMGNNAAVDFRGMSARHLPRSASACRALVGSR